MHKQVLFILGVLASTSIQAQPTLTMPFDTGQWWGPTTYPGHPGAPGARENAIDWWFISQQSTGGTQTFPYWSQGTTLGKNIVAAHAGTVIQNGWNANGYGEYVIIRAAPPYSTYTTHYAHLQTRSAPAVGSAISARQLVGTAGTTGSSTSPHLHFELRNNNTSVNISNLVFDGQPLVMNYSQTEPIGGGDFRYKGPALQSTGVGVANPTATIVYNPPAGLWYNTVAPSTEIRYQIGGGNPNEVEEIYVDGSNNYLGWLGQYVNKPDGFINLNVRGVGWHGFSVRAKRPGSSTWSQSNVWYGGYDNIPPSSSRTSGATPDVWLRGTHSVTYTGTDAHSGFKDSQWWFGSSPVNNWSTANPRVVDLPTQSGQYPLYVQTVDNTYNQDGVQFGNYQDQYLGNYKVDNTSPTTPTFTANPPTGGSPTGVTLQVSSSDAHSGMNRIEVRANGILVGTINGAAGSVLWNTSGVPYSNTIRVTAIDNVGNEVDRYETYLADNSGPTQPSLIDEGALTSSGSSLSFLVEVTDPQSGVSEFEYKLGTTPGDGNLRPNTLVAPSAYITLGNLNLPHGSPIYLSLRAKNGNGVWGPWGNSDGILFDLAQIPVMTSPTVVASGGEMMGSNNLLEGTLGEVISRDGTAGFWAHATWSLFSGQIQLGSYTGIPEIVPITFQLVQGGVVVETLSVSQTSTGTVSFVSEVEGQTDIYAIAGTWLRKHVGAFDIIPGENYAVNAALINGDADGDNEVGPGDFEMVVSNFGLSVSIGTSGDIDGNGEVGPGDFEVIVQNFGISGD